MNKMKLILIVFSLITLSYAQSDLDETILQIFNSTENNFLKDYEEVTPPPLESLEALQRCGEGDQLDKFICVPYHNCNPNTDTVIRQGSVDGAGIINVRANDRRCEHYLDVCCRVPSNFTDATDLRNPSLTSTTTRSPTVTAVPDDNNANFCGIRNANGVGFKITGNVDNEAEFGEFPWMVAILNKNYDPASNQPLAICGGSLITPRTVLTGAHCVTSQRPDNLVIRAGEWDTQTQNEFIPYQERNVTKIIAHTGYISTNLYNDVALLILDRPFTKARNVGTVCLPSPNQRFNTRNCFTTGWGKTLFGKEGRYSTILKKIQLPMVERAECQRALRNTRLGAAFVLHESFTCAGGELGKDACTGDGGSPLVCADPNNPNRYIQTGIVAWGIGCAEYRVPGVYVDVARFRNWIDTELRKENINSDPYVI